jgi:hypothetical protein
MDTFEVTWQWAGGRFTSFDRVEAQTANGAVSALHRRLRRDFEGPSGEIVVVQVERVEPTQSADPTDTLAPSARGGSVAMREHRGLARLTKWRQAS